MDSCSNFSSAQLDEGTLFVDGPGTSIQTDQDIINWLTARFPGLYFSITNVTAVKELLQYYPRSPAAGSPYGTGNETFGRGAQYKRFASLFGDLAFQVSLGLFHTGIISLNPLSLGSPPRSPEEYSQIRCQRLVSTLAISPSLNMVFTMSKGLISSRNLQGVPRCMAYLTETIFRL